MADRPPEQAEARVPADQRVLDHCVELLLPAQPAALAGDVDAVFASFDGGPVYPLPAEVVEESRADIEAIREQLGNPGHQQALGPFAQIDMTVDGRHWRACSLTPLDTALREGAQTRWWKLSRVMDVIPELKDCAIDPVYEQALLSLGHRRGLVVVSGRGGAGKTVLLSSIVRATIAQHGGFGVVLGRTNDLPLHGRHRDGLLLQVPYASQANTAGPAADDQEAMPLDRLVDSALAWRANLIMIDEIRSAEQAIALLRLINAGFLVFTTIHAESLAMSLAAIEGMVDGRFSGWRSVLASSIVAAMHVEVTSMVRIRSRNSSDRPKPIRRVHTAFATVNDGDPLRAAIRAGTFERIATIRDAQQATLSSYTPETATRLAGPNQQLDAALLRAGS